MANYVKFIRGTPSAYENLQIKEADTLYFISEATSTIGKLYIGDKLISSEMSQEDLKFYLKNLEDVDITGAKQNDLLSYDATNQKWIPINLGIENDTIINIQSNIEDLQKALGKPESDSSDATGIYAELNNKINVDEVYNKNQIDTIISEINALQRKKVNSINDIDLNASDAEKYLYMVPSSNSEGNKYEEYIIIDNAIEKIGTIGTGSGEINIINAINEEEFSVSTDGFRTLNLKAVPAVKISGIEENETIKIIQKDVATLKSSNESIIERLDTVESNILELQVSSTWGIL